MAEDSLHTPKYSLPYPATSSDVKPASEDFKGLALSTEVNLAESETRATQKVAALDAAVSARGYVNGADPRVMQRSPDRDYAWAVTDSGGQIAGGVRRDGRWDFSTDPEVQGEPRTTYRPGVDGEYVWAVVDKSGRAAIAVKRDGTVIAPSLVEGGVQWSTDMSARVASDMAGMLRSDRMTFACLGDSLSYLPGGDSYPDQLRDLMPSTVTVGTHGRSGYTADEILMQVGAIPLTVEVPGGKIAATGDTPVVVHGAETAGWTATGTDRTVPGSVAGVDGALIRSGGSNTDMVFRRTAGGSEVTATSEPLVPLWGYDLNSTLIALMGRNDLNQGILGPHSSIPDHIVAAYERLEGAMGPDIRHFLALSVTNRTVEPAGSSGHTLVTEINSRLRERFGPRFLDIRTHLVRDGLSEAGLAPTPEDEAAMAEDCIPPQLMTDPTHWNAIGAGLVAGWVHDYLTSRDWIGS